MSLELSRGVVAAFDDHRGWGTVRGADGAEFGFHCTAISDGSRHVKPGAEVVFRVCAKGPGHFEATAIVT